MTSGADVTIACPHCRQTLSAPAHDLRASVQCPRCREVVHLGAHVPLQTPVPAAVVVSPAPIGVIDSSLQRAPAALGGLPAISSSAPAPVAWHGAPARDVSWQPGIGAPQAQVLVGEPDPAQQTPTERFGYWLLDGCQRIDDQLRGGRAVLIASAAFLTAGVGRLADAHFGQEPLIRSCLCVLFLWLCFALAVGRVASFRDDDGSWSLGVLSDNYTSPATTITSPHPWRRDSSAWRRPSLGWRGRQLATGERRSGEEADGRDAEDRIRPA